MPATAGPFQPVELLHALAARQVEFILIGGLAASIHGSPYATSDVDVVPRADHVNLQRLSAALRDVDARVYVDRDEALPFDHDATSLRRAATWNLATRHGGLDITFVPSGTSGFSDLRAHAERVDIDGVPVLVASLDDIIRNKEAAGRERDRIVLPVLRTLRTDR